MSMTLRLALQQASQMGGTTIADVDRLLQMQWRELWESLPVPLNGDAQTIYQFLEGMRHEFGEGYWDGEADEDMANRIRDFVGKLQKTTSG